MANEMFRVTGITTFLVLILIFEVSGLLEGADNNTMENDILFLEPIISPALDNCIQQGSCILSDSVTQNDYINVTEQPGELCKRQCIENDRRVCYFKFVLEHYQAMGVACGKCTDGVVEDCYHPQCIIGDGIEKGVMSINRKVPGPDIQVCKNDRIIIDVVNNAHGTAVGIHWHGLHMRQTPFMDGVPFTTQCPIPFSTTFRYSFWATEAGTHFYHAHSGHHKVNGQYGALIIREPRNNDPHSYHYDEDLPDHHILISDYMHNYGEQHFPGLPSLPGILPKSILINGRGTYTDPKTRAHTTVPATTYLVKPGKRYRFRVINSFSNSCPVKLQIENHNMTIIASDSYNIRPSSFGTLVSNAGERYDFVITINTSKRDFWIRVTGMGLCANSIIESFALLRSESNESIENDQRPQPPYPVYNETYPPGTILNHPNATCFNINNDHCVTELVALEQDIELLTKAPDHKFFLAFHNFPVPNEEIFQPGKYQQFINPQSNETIVSAINNLSLVFPSSPPLTQPSDINELEFCDESQRPSKCIGKKLCQCIHRLKVRQNSIVELIIVDESTVVGRLHHPFHLHGYRFIVTGLGQFRLRKRLTISDAMQIEKLNGLPRNYHSNRPPFKDTVSIPSHGYAVLRFRADNPGFWLMHCHYEWHLAIGMGLIVQVGTTKEMVPPPKDFPKCGNYLPNIRMR